MSFEETYETGQANIKIVKFARRNNYYLYVYDGATRKVGYASMGSSDLEYCKSNWFKTYDTYVRKGGSAKQIMKTSLTRKLKEYIDYQFSRVETGEIKERSFKTFHERVRNRITTYVKQSGYKNIQELHRKSFVDFASFFKAQGYDASTINSDLTTLNHFLNWLVEDDLLDLGKKPVMKKLQQVKDYKRDANPAFSGEDWSKFKEYLYRYEFLDEAWTDDVEEKEKWWYRKIFVCWVLFQQQSGNRPHETTALTYGDVAIKEYELKDGNTTLQGIVHIDRDTKRGQRTSIMNGTYIKRIIQHLHSYQHPKWLAVETNDDTPLFINPMTGKAMHNETFRHHFKNVLRHAGLEDKGYTPYSLRSTHITMMLLRGTSVDDVARNLGTSADMIRRHYDGVQNIMKSDELLKLNKHYYQDKNQLQG